MREKFKTTIDKLRFVGWRLFRLVRGISSRIAWLLPRALGYIRTLISLGLSLGFTMMGQTNSTVIKFDLKSILVFFTLFSVILIALNFLMSILHKFAIEPNERTRALVPRPQRGESIWTNCGQSFLTNRGVNVKIECASNPIIFDKTLPSLDPLVELFQGHFILKLVNEKEPAGYDTIDDKKISLRDNICEDLLERNLHVKLQRTSYFRDRLSNGLINWKVSIDERPAFDFIDEAYDLLQGPRGTSYWRLKDLANSRLSNQIGASGILITKDMYVVMLKQASRSAENKNKLAPSGSGSFDWKSARKHSGSTLQALVRGELVRELTEECGLKVDDIVSVHICGFGRYLYRAGKPEFFCIATTSRLYNEIRIPVREWDYQSKFKHGEQLTRLNRSSFEKFRQSIAVELGRLQRKLENNNSSRPVSGPLIWNLRLAADYLQMSNKEQLLQLLRALN